MSEDQPQAAPAVHDSELALWSAVQGGRKVHAFTFKPEAQAVTFVALCRDGLLQNSGRPSSGERCPDCERILGFLRVQANRCYANGFKRGSALGSKR